MQKVIVIGGGVVGISCALKLQDEGMKLPFSTLVNRAKVQAGHRAAVSRLASRATIKAWHHATCTRLDA